MIAATIESNLAELNAKLSTYAAHRKITVVQAVQKHSQEFAFLLADELKKTSPARGSIRSGALAWLKNRSKGVNVRPSIMKAVREKYNLIQDITTRRFVIGGKRGKGTVTRGKGANKKKLNIRALMVQRELNMRERGIRFMAVSARLKGLSAVSPGSAEFWLGRFGQKTADAKLLVSATGDEATMRITYGGSKSEFGDALQNPFAQAAIATALQRTLENMEVYIERKEREAAEAME
jgi:hypothetical protein